tara:strand:+ start:7418 stop:9061 length:1644 start_codon:yes stop_codon:yes gene_type:complete
MEIFGYEIKKRLAANSKPEEKNLKSFVPKYDDEGVQTVAVGGYYGQYYDVDGTDVSSDRELILKYRAAAEQPECDSAIDDIVDEAICSGVIGAPVKLDLDNLSYEDDIKEKIQNEFDHVVKLLKFNENGADLFRRWYIDGKIYFHIVVDSEDPKSGIQDLRFIDPIHMKKIRELSTETDPLTGVTVQETEEEYFIFNEEDSAYQSAAITGQATMGLKVASEAIIYVTSGIMDSTREKVLSYLHKSVKLVNQLRMLEDALVIYRISRAPERRIFYIDVGNLPKGKAEEYVRNMMSQYRNKIVYDATTGEVRDDRRHKSMLEDFWLPRREGGRGTEITTLPGGDNLGEIEDILFFQKKLYKSLNVPLSRLESDTGFNVGRATEINREEVKFQKFIDRLRNRFSYVFLDALETQLILKGIIAEEDWDSMKEDISIDYVKDNYFAELKEFEIMKDRVDMVGQIEPLVEQGYYSKEWIRKNILQQTDEEIDMLDKQLADEKGGGERQDDMMAATDPQGELESDLGSNDSLEDDIDFDIEEDIPEDIELENVV